MSADTIVSSLSLLLSLTLAAFYLRDRLHAKFSLENDYVSSLLGWHGEVVTRLVSARCLGFQRDSQEHREHLASLSALIERGRFYFPNIVRDSFGEDKPPAYRGYRNLVLDFLVASYNLLQEIPSADSREQLELLQRHFTSAIYDLVAPTKRLETIHRLTDRYFTTEKSFEDFLEHRDGTIIRNIWRR